MGEAFGIFQQLIIKSNGRAHVAKHVDQASICQAAFLLAKDERQGSLYGRPSHRVFLARPARHA